MKAENMRFGEFIRLKRKKDARKLRLKDVATQMGISVSLLSDIESGRRNPFEPEQIDWFAQEFDLTQEEKELMYDLAAKELRNVPYDIEQLFSNPAFTNPYFDGEDGAANWSYYLGDYANTGKAYRWHEEATTCSLDGEFRASGLAIRCQKK